jgi:signal transduction histidine kinase
VLVSRVGSFVSSIVASTFAALCLIHLVPPVFSFRVNDPLDDVAVIAFLATSLVIARLMSRVRKQAQEALTSVSYRVIEAEEQERRRIAKDLHENVGQSLTMLTLAIEQLKRDSLNAIDAPVRIDAVWKQSLEVLNNIKTLAHELYSPRLEYLGIAGVMKSFCADFGEQNEVEVDFKSEGLPSCIEADVSLCLFRVLQEALHNAVKHSGARQFDGQLWATSDEIHLTVRDRGLGFDVAKARKAGGLGLNRMQERLKLVRGSLSIDSQPHRGTTIHARAPLGLGRDSKILSWTSSQARRQDSECSD